MPVLHWWFVVVPVWLFEHTAPPANGGFGAAIAFGIAALTYAAVTLLAIGYALLGLASAGKFVSRAFLQGFRAGWKG